MPPKKREAGAPRAYGRQATGKTIKSLSLAAELASWAEQQAAKEGISFSAWIERTLRGAQMTTSLSEESDRYNFKPPAKLPKKRT